LAWVGCGKWRARDGILILSVDAVGEASRLLEGSLWRLGVEGRIKLATSNVEVGDVTRGYNVGASRRSRGW